jgi:hypothetical protein
MAGRLGSHPVAAFYTGAMLCFRAAMKELLSQNWLGSLIGLVGIGLAIVFAFYVRPRPRLASQVNSLELLGNNQALPKEIEFFFRGQKVPKVTLSRIAIWNMGNVTFRRDQIVAADPLRIVTSSGSEVLDARILDRTREVNDFSCAVRESRNEVECTFDYLDSRDGASVEVIHTGDAKLQVVGTLRGVPKAVLVVAVPKAPETKQTAPLSRFGAVMLGATLVLIGASLLAFGLVSDHESKLGALLVGFALAFLGVVALAFLGRIPPYPLNTQITSGAPPKKRSIFRR